MILQMVRVSGPACLMRTRGHTHTHTHTHTHRCGIKSIAPFHSLLSESLSLPELLLSFPGTGQPGPAGQDWGFLAPALYLCDFFMQSATALLVESPSASAGDMRDMSSTCVRKIPWRREQLPTPVLLPGESLGQRSLIGYGPWGCEESDTTGVA